ncbi:DNA mismatch repair protein MutT [Streptomyces spongiicola]|uniref:DNA mismatch repair protein MutT n=1 Tax=Streptomyces spongiicola TaxID=1690221 RepID=A0ABN5KVB6_9ACTN|nr:NUDIX domain-containing protein [Streptomyces spongiicola]AWK12451.1 DNA mismatch repair protein MutT [Streptomyces spongiicola]
MSGKRSAGLLLFRGTAADLEVLIGHMGGPCRAAGDEVAWPVPKGGYGPEERPEAAARREPGEELGLPASDGGRIALGESRQGGGGSVTVRAVEGDLDPRSVVPGTLDPRSVVPGTLTPRSVVPGTLTPHSVVPGTLTMQRPPRSGVPTGFPEVDRVGRFPLERAAEPLVPGRRTFLERLAHHIRGGR